MLPRLPALMALALVTIGAPAFAAPLATNFTLSGSSVTWDSGPMLGAPGNFETEIRATEASLLGVDEIAVAFFIDGQYAGTHAPLLSPLPQGQTFRVPLTNERAGRVVCQGCWTITEGVHELRLVLDPDQKVDETNEADNLLVDLLTIGQGPPTH